MTHSTLNFYGRKQSFDCDFDFAFLLPRPIFLFSYTNSTSSCTVDVCHTNNVIRMVQYVAIYSFIRSLATTHIAHQTNNNLLFPIRFVSVKCRITKCILFARCDRKLVNFCLMCERCKCVVSCQRGSLFILFALLSSAVDCITHTRVNRMKRYYFFCLDCGAISILRKLEAKKRQ